MIKIKVWDNKEIDTLSDEIKDKVSQSIADYVLKHWDKSVDISTSKFNGKYEAEFTVIL